MLRANPDLLGGRFYNTYARSRTLKVYFHIETRAARVRARALHRTLVGLADYADEGQRGGYIYGFKKGA